MPTPPPGPSSPESETISTERTSGGIRPEGLSLLPGASLGPYRILGLLGTGGMGEVYRARDTKLDREVALKVIAGGLTGDPAGAARFEREAKTLAATAHPNILAIHDFGNEQGLSYLVTELLDGETLREMLLKGPLDVRTAVKVMRQVALGLSAAHDRGIIHRDLKPGNIFVGRDDHAKILDFGLARLAGTDSDREGGASRAGPADGRTEAGKVLGTGGYMSPEQVRGLPLDARSDVFALGIVLYEALSGRRPFRGFTDAESLTALLEEDPPPISGNGQQVPQALEQAILQCLEKDPSRRPRTAREVALALEQFVEADSVQMAALEARRSAVVKASLWGGLALAVTAVIAGWAMLVARNASVPPFKPRQVTGLPGLEGAPALSPDGSSVAFALQDEEGSAVYVKDVRGGAPLKLATSAVADPDPAWFPDGSALAFTARSNGEPAIYKVPRYGGTPELLVANAEDPAISRDGRMLAFSRAGSEGVRRIWVAMLADETSARRLTGLGDGTWDHLRPAWSPDGRLICYHSQNNLWVVPAGGGRARRLTADDAPDMDPAWSPSGKYVYFDSLREGAFAIWRVGASGGLPERITLGSGSERFPSLSLDGRRLAYGTAGYKLACTLIDRATGRQTWLPADYVADGPSFSPDGQWLAFCSEREGGTNVWKVHLKEGQPDGEPLRLTDQPGSCANTRFSPDGRWVAYHRVMGGQRDVWVVPATGGAPVNFTYNPAMDAQPAWSPDGSQIAFMSDRVGSPQVWVAPFRDGHRVGEPTEITRVNGDVSNPCWSHDGTRLTFIVSNSHGSDVWVAPASGKGPAVRLTTDVEAQYILPEAAPAGFRVLGKWGGGRGTLRVLPLTAGEARPVPYGAPTGSTMSLLEAALSRDGRFLALFEEETEGNVWLLQAERGSF